MGNYHIRRGYVCNTPINSTSSTYVQPVENSRIFQYNIYLFAKKIIQKNNLKHVLDIGCGPGEKLKEIIRPICEDITGIDGRESIEKCRENDFGTWFIDDVENPSLDLEKKFDLIIASDIIEHLGDPNLLLDYIKNFSDNDTYILISTPERGLLSGVDTSGPPTNKLHVREWNKEEFYDYISGEGFRIIKHVLVEDKKGSKNLSCQLVLCKIKDF